jgi:hypothetical protein
VDKDVKEKHALEYIYYYGKLVHEEPGQPEWVDGLKISQRFLQLLNAREPTQQGVDDLLRALEDNSAPGTMWVGLYTSAWRWAKQRGFAVPERPNYWAR